MGREQNSAIWNAFREGATRPSWLALGLAIVTATAWITAANTLITPESVMDHASYYARGPADHAAIVTSRALRLASSDPAERRMIIVGAVANLAGLSANAAEQRLEELANAATAVVDLRYPSQTLWESAALADAAPFALRGVLVLDVTSDAFVADIRRLTALNARPRLGCRFAAWHEELAVAGLEAPPLRGYYFLDNQSFFLARIPTMARNLPRVIAGGADELFESETTTADANAASRVMTDSQSPITAAESLHVELNTAVIERIARRLARNSELNFLLVAEENDLAVTSHLTESLQSIAQRHDNAHYLAANLSRQMPAELVDEALHTVAAILEQSSRRRGSP